MKPKLKNIIKKAFKEAIRLGDQKIKPEHLFLSILEDKNNKTIEVFNEMGADTKNLSEKLEAYLRIKIRNPKIVEVKIIPLSDVTRQVLSSSKLESDKLRDDVIDIEHLTLAILKNKTLDVTKVLGNQGITYKTFRETLLNLKKEKIMNTTGDFDEIDETKKNKKTNHSRSATPILDNFGRDVTKVATDGQIDPIIGRSDEIERVAQILSRRKKNNPILIGEPGCVVGDTMITIRRVSDENKHKILVTT